MNVGAHLHHPPTRDRQERPLITHASRLRVFQLRVEGRRRLKGRERRREPNTAGPGREGGWVGRGVTCVGAGSLGGMNRDDYTWRENNAYVELKALVVHSLGVGSILYIASKEPIPNLSATARVPLVCVCHCVRSVPLTLCRASLRLPSSAWRGGSAISLAHLFNPCAAYLESAPAAAGLSRRKRVMIWHSCSGPTTFQVVRNASSADTSSSPDW